MKSSIKSLFLIASIILGLFSCSSSHHSSYLSGEITKEVLLENNQIFRDNLMNYRISDTDKALVDDWPSNLHIDIFFGTWCHDSQREVPKLLGILQENSNVTLQLIALGTDKSDPKKLGQSNKVKFTPTFIIKLEGKEIGRVIERPDHSLVRDISDFITENKT